MNYLKTETRHTQLPNSAQIAFHAQQAKKERGVTNRPISVSKTRFNSTRPNFTVDGNGQ